MYSYVNRGFKAGHIYAFGLAIHFGKILDDSETGKIEKVLKDDLHWNSITVKVPVQFFVICMNKRLEAFLKGYDLASVPLLGELPFHEALSPDKFVDKLVNRDYEGYVFSVPSMLLKWKAFEEVSISLTFTSSFFIQKCLAHLFCTYVQLSFVIFRPKETGWGFTKLLMQIFKIFLALGLKILRLFRF